MPSTQYSKEQVAALGEAIYENSLRDKLEDQFLGKILVIDIESGDYEIDDTTLPAADRLRARRPDAVLYSLRIGYNAVYGFGSEPRRVKR